MGKLGGGIVLAVWLVVLASRGFAGIGPYDWQNYDNFDEITDRMDAVDAENCYSKPASELHLPEETLAQLPRFNRLLSTIIYPNRTNLLHLHNMALNRAFFYSYMYQKLNKSQEDFVMQPGLMYYYFSAAADVSANEYGINGSAVFFDNNGSYANWYRDLPFNTTLPLFGPRAYRLDDFNDPTNWLREPTNRTIDILDYGAGPQSNYTTTSYKINQWYNLWLPDGWDKSGLDSVRKHSYDVKIKYANGTGKFMDTRDEEGNATIFFGPPSPGQNEQEHLPVVFTEPYFDCGRSNKWIVSAVSPIVDWLPRYLEWLHIRRFQFVAVSVMDIDYLSIDYNPCPHFGQELPGYFAGTDRCKPKTTRCEPLYGWGFRRGGYQCACQPGYRLPPWQNRPFQGRDIESATDEEYKNGFDCFPVDLRQVFPIIRGNETIVSYESSGKKKKRSVAESQMNRLAANGYIPNRPEFARIHNQAAKEPAEPLQSRILNKKLRLLRLAGLQEKKTDGARVKIVARQEYHPQSYEAKKKEALKTKFQARYKRSTAHHRVKRQAFDAEAWERMQMILEHKEEVTRLNCMNYKRSELVLPGDVSYGVEKQFSPQARTALRLSHFLSNFLQNIDRFEEYGTLRGDQLLNVEQIFGEVLANVMGDLNIKGSGVFFDIDKFEDMNGTRQFFGPYAYDYEEDKETGGPQGQRVNTQFRAIDFAGLPNHYLDEEWFRTIKERWQSNTYGLTKFTEKPLIRSDLAGTSLKKFEMYPMYYYSPKEDDGLWTTPYYDCDGFVKDWVITYSVPFFGLNSIRSSLEFKGVVRVDVRLDELDINQCPQEYHIPNAFKATARCHYESTYCEHLPSKKFTKGAYKCECQQGYEYPFNDRAWYYDGQTMEEEYRKKIAGYQNRFDTLVCRIAGASGVTYSIASILLPVAVYLLSSHSV